MHRRQRFLLTGLLVAGACHLGCKEERSASPPRGTDNSSGPRTAPPKAPPPPAQPAEPRASQPPATAPQTEPAKQAGGGPWQGGGIAWTVPAGWAQEPGSGMRFATLRPEGPTGTLEVNVSHFPGDVGGMPNNINRWRTQIGLESVGAEQIGQMTEDLSVAGEQAKLVDLVNEQANQRLITVVVPHAGRTWFFKLSGPVTEVAKHKDGLLKFASSVRFTDSGGGT